MSEALPSLALLTVHLGALVTQLCIETEQLTINYGHGGDITATGVTLDTHLHGGNHSEKENTTVLRPVTRKGTYCAQ